MATHMTNPALDEYGDLPPTEVDQDNPGGSLMNRWWELIKANWSYFDDEEAKETERVKKNILRYPNPWLVAVPPVLIPYYDKIALEEVAERKNNGPPTKNEENGLYSLSDTAVIFLTHKGEHIPPSLISGVLFSPLGEMLSPIEIGDAESVGDDRLRRHARALGINPEHGLAMCLDLVRNTRDDFLERCEKLTEAAGDCELLGGVLVEEGGAALETSGKPDSKWDDPEWLEGYGTRLIDNQHTHTIIYLALTSYMTAAILCDAEANIPIEEIAYAVFASEVRIPTLSNLMDAEAHKLDSWSDANVFWKACTETLRVTYSQILAGDTGVICALTNSEIPDPDVLLGVQQS